MSVILQTSLGDIVVDLYVKERPKTSLNFLKLCQLKYYNGCEFFSIQKDFLIQTGDPEGTGRGGNSIWGLINNRVTTTSSSSTSSSSSSLPQEFFKAEETPEISHKRKGLVSMAAPSKNTTGSQFFITTGEDMDYLDERCTVFGEVAEGLEVVQKINETFVDEKGRPFKVIRIRHTIVLEDPFDDPPGLWIPEASPEPKPLTDGRLEEEEPINENQGRTQDEIQEAIEQKQAKARAEVLEILGDLPDADVAPPENVLFVCKLNPATEEEGLATIFGRFGRISSVEIIRDQVTGNSLCYGFIEFEDAAAAEEAFFKMDNVLIDDRRIHVDFSQSVSKLKHLTQLRDEQRAVKDDKKGSTRGPGNLSLKQPSRSDDKYRMVFDVLSSSSASSKRPRSPDQRRGSGRKRSCSPDKKREMARRLSRSPDRKERPHSPDRRRETGMKKRSRSPNQRQGRGADTKRPHHHHYSPDRRRDTDRSSNNKRSRSPDRRRESDDRRKRVY